jgi:flagellar biosynthetic protein FlhB
MRKAREDEGRVAKSQDLVSALVLLVPALALIFLAPSFMRTCTEMVSFFLSRATQIDPVSGPFLARVFLSYFVRLALPITAAALVAGLGANIAQVGFFWTTKPLAFKASRIIPNFGQYFGKTVFSLNGLFNFFKSIVKMGIVGVVAFLLIRGDINKLANLQSANLWASISLVASLAARLLIICALLMLVLAIPDYLFQRYQYRESLRMSVYEVKEERKQDEGDPQIKAKLRQRMNVILRKNLRQRLPKADVVITNPTHLAVALDYNEIGPRVLVKGEDETALAIRRLAFELGVPIVENKPLARAIYADVPEGEIVPQRYWNAIITVLSKVMDVNEARRRRG